MRPPAHESETVGACGPPYVMNQTGYFLPVSRSGGNTSSASRRNPSLVGIFILSRGPNRSRLFSYDGFESSVRTSRPSAA